MISMVRQALLLASIMAIAVAGYFIAADRETHASAAGGEQRTPYALADSKSLEDDAPPPEESVVDDPETAVTEPTRTATGGETDREAIVASSTGGVSKSSLVAEKGAELFEVRFTVQGLDPKDPGAMQLVLASEGRAVPTLVVDPRGAASALLPAGDYLCAAQDSKMRLGAVASFAVSGESNVSVAAPFSFSVEFRVQDLDSKSAVQSGHAMLERVDLPDGAGWEASTIRADCDVEGQVRLSDVSPGRWRLSVDAVGYESFSQVVAIPAEREQEARTNHRVDYGSFWLTPLADALFQLVGANPSDQLSDFRIAHRHDGEPVAFDSTGKATVPIGRYEDPLYMKLWYPDGTQVILFVMGGLPAAENPHEIQVGGARELDVRLELSREIEEMLDGRDKWVRVAFQQPGYERRTVGIDIETSGVYRCSGILADEVTVSLITMDESLPTDWKSAWVKLEPEGVTTTTFVVDEVPRRLKLVDPEGEPVADVPFSIYALPNTTGWTGDGRTNEDGTCAVTHVEDREAMLFASSDDERRYAIEVPLDLRSIAPDPVVVLGGKVETYVEVVCDHTPTSEIWADIRGMKTGVFYASLSVGEEGRSKGIELHPDSNAEFVLYPGEYWTDLDSRPLLQGRNALPVWKKGTLRVGAVRPLASVVSDEFGTDLESWSKTGKIDVAAPEDGFVDCTVPAGVYRWTGPDGDEQTVTLVGGETATIP
jgi:hypothetical protein